MPQYKKELKRGIRWYYRFSFQGTIYRSNAIYLSRTDAKKAEAQKFNDTEAQIGTSGENSEIFLLDLINERLDYLKITKSEKYYAENKHYLKIFFVYFGNVNIKDISRGEIQKLLLDESKQKQQQQRDNYAVNAMLRAVKSLFFYGIKYRELNMVNPCLGINFYSVKKKLKYIPTDKEIARVLANCNLEQRLLTEFVRDTGCRISEALKLTYRDVFEGYVVLYTRKSKSSNLTPRRAEYDALKLRYRENIDDRVFDSWSETPKFLSKKTAGKWNWHNLRHRFASILSKKGTPLFEIMTLLGHSKMETTQKYLQLLP